MIGVAGVANSGAITTLTNSGTISGGGATGFSRPHVVGRRRGVQLRHDHDADQQRRDRAEPAALTSPPPASGGAGGAGVSNSGTIATLTNKGTISGGNGVAGF